MIDYVIYDRKSGNECWFVLCKISLIYHISVYVLMAWYVMVRANKIYKINYCIFGIYHTRMDKKCRDKRYDPHKTV